MTQRPPLVLHEGHAFLPRGTHGLSAEYVEASQRGRLLQAMAEVVADKGYTSASIADVIARARVSRKTYYAYFTDKEDCFATAYEIAADLHLRRVAKAAAAEGEWLPKLHAGAREYLAALADTPAFARSFLVEVMAAGPRVLAQREHVLRRYVTFFQEVHALVRADLGGLPPLPDDLFLALAGGGNELVAAAVRDGRAAELAELEQTLVFLQVSVMAGPAVAATAVS